MKIELNESGYLKDPALWNEAIAEELAKMDHMQLNSDHWRLIYFLRAFYQKHENIPPLRILIRAIQKELGEELGNSIAIHKLFPQTPLVYLCKYAGLPKPKHCM